MKQWAKIDAVAPSFPLDHITEYKIDNEPGQFTVQSQSNPNITYHVNIEAYTCECASYSLIFYCKHLAAIQLHFYEELNLLPMDTLFTTASKPIASLGSSNHIADTMLTEPNPNLAILAQIPSKLQRLAVCTQLSPPQHMSNCL